MTERIVFAWDSEAGREATQRLEAWGAVLREREATGDASIPSSSGGGGRGKPGDLPAIWHRSMDVDMTLGEYKAGPWLHRLLIFIYRDGFEFVTSVKRDTGEVAEGVVLYVLADGGTIELTHDAPPPVGYLECRYEPKARYGYDLDKFADAELDELLRRYYPVKGKRFYRYRRKFLERARFDFAEFMARRRGLGEFEAVSVSDVA